MHATVLRLRISTCVYVRVCVYIVCVGIRSMCVHSLKPYQLKKKTHSKQKTKL